MRKLHGVAMMGCLMAMATMAAAQATQQVAHTYEGKMPDGTSVSLTVQGNTATLKIDKKGWSVDALSCTVAGTKTTFAGAGSADDRVLSASGSVSDGTGTITLKVGVGMGARETKVKLVEIIKN